MDYVETASGKRIQTDYLSAIPMPKMMFFTALNITIPELTQIVCDKDEMETIKYNNYTFTDCTFSSISTEGDAIKVALLYEQMRKDA